VALVIISGLAYQYLELRQNYNRLKSQVKYEITSHLISSEAFAKKIDLNKIITGDKNSILNMMHMYEDISNLDDILTTTYYYGKIDVIDSLIPFFIPTLSPANELVQNKIKLFKKQVKVPE
jgi:hypothetical protein